MCLQLWWSGLLGGREHCGALGYLVDGLQVPGSGPVLWVTLLVCSETLGAGALFPSLGLTALLLTQRVELDYLLGLWPHQSGLGTVASSNLDDVSMRSDGKGSLPVISLLLWNKLPHT